ncbi:PaaI family thioesterase [Aurantibacillus circumpalustris]|uniref:PaaI family thioesterase n=1 Tax=Aurantibacillus circumpalustris TaxID=3036359 RepID=UPI00295AD12E|nr:PaaI family thioesterase [Aurantibacillus circumpalustris]
MKSHNALEILQSFIGKEFVESPSPFTKWLNPIVMYAETGRVSFRYLIRADMTNPLKGLHGGVTAAIIDDVVGATLFSYNEPFFYTTLNNVIDYFSPAKIGDVIFAETIVIKKGKQIVNVQCEVWNEEKNRLIARGYSNLLKTSFEK